METIDWRGNEARSDLVLISSSGAEVAICSERLVAAAQVLDASRSWLACWYSSRSLPFVASSSVWDASMSLRRLPTTSAVTCSADGLSGSESSAMVTLSPTSAMASHADANTAALRHRLSGTRKLWRIAVATGDGRVFGFETATGQDSILIRILLRL